MERATAVFAEVQAAYEVLSDPQERAWYDSHESSILRGGNEGTEEHFEHNVKVTTAENIMNIISRFHGSISYTDSPTGFYGFLRETFAQLAKEEEIAADWAGTDVVDYPSFGHAEDTHEEVAKPFYTVWASFGTAKSFAWRDKWRLSDAPDRRIRRLMEKENKASRDERIREFNDAVRSLVAFVRKRDPRYKPDNKTDADRERVLRDATAAQKARQRAENEAKMNEQVPEWIKTRDPEEEESEEEEVEEDHYECVACGKTFKSERQFDAHEKSKKHQKAVEAVRKQMRKQNRNLNLDGDVSSGVATPLSDDADLVEMQKPSDGTQKVPPGPPSEVTNGNGFADADEDLRQSIHELHLNGSSEKTVQDKQELEVSTPSLSDSDLDDSYASRQDVEAHLSQSKPQTHPDESPPLLSGTRLEASSPDQLDASSQTTPKAGKAAQKRAKKAAQQAASDSASNQYSCAACNATFPSKTRMHQHVKDFGHAQPVSQVGKGGGKGKKR